MAIQSFRCHDNFFHVCLDKGDIIGDGVLVVPPLTKKLNYVISEYTT